MVNAKTNAERIQKSIRTLFLCRAFTGDRADMPFLIQTFAQIVADFPPWAVEDTVAVLIGAYKHDPDAGVDARGVLSKEGFELKDRFLPASNVFVDMVTALRDSARAELHRLQQLRDAKVVEALPARPDRVVIPKFRSMDERISRLTKPAPAVEAETAGAAPSRAMRFVPYMNSAFPALEARWVAEYGHRPPHEAVGWDFPAAWVEGHG